MSLRKLSVSERPASWMTVGQEPVALVVWVGRFVWTFLLSSFSVCLEDDPI